MVCKITELRTCARETK